MTRDRVFIDEGLAFPAGFLSKIKTDVSKTFYLSFPSFCFIKAVSLIHLVFLTDYHKSRDIRNTFSYTFPEQFSLVLVNGHPEYLHSATRLKESLFLSNCSNLSIILLIENKKK